MKKYVIVLRCEVEVSDELAEWVAKHPSYKTEEARRQLMLQEIASNARDLTMPVADGGCNDILYTKVTAYWPEHLPKEGE
jgi:hypothetical protein